MSASDSQIWLYSRLSMRSLAVSGPVLVIYNISIMAMTTSSRSAGSRTKTTGVIMCDQVKALDMHSRNADFIEKAPDDLVAETVDIVPYWYL
jgi:mRNA-degrading endonuclease toxin of MazEF toxin-antitoxin module